MSEVNIVAKKTILKLNINLTNNIIEDEKQSPFLQDVSNINKSSEERVLVRCQLQTSDKCIISGMFCYRSVLRNMKRNNDKYICMHCSLSKGRTENIIAKMNIKREDQIDYKNDHYNPEWEFYNNLENVNDPNDTDFIPPQTPFLSNITGLSDGSGMQVFVICQSQVHEKCAKIQLREYKSIIKSINNNDGIYICMYCLGKITCYGRTGRFCVIKSLNDKFMKNIDTVEKSYFLGWVASDGTLNREGGLCIEIHMNDLKILECLRDIVCKELKIYKRKNRDCIILKICSMEMVSDICNILNIKPGKKCDVVDFPKLANDKLSWAFLRGMVDGDGHITKLTARARSIGCSIASISSNMRNGIENFTKIKCHNTPLSIFFFGENGMKFLNKLYEFSTENTRLHRKYIVYLEYFTWDKGISFSGSKCDEFKFTKTNKNAIFSLQNNVDNEYNLYATDCKIIDDTKIQYDTNIKILPKDDFYMEIEQSNFLDDCGYILENTTIIYDYKYVTSIKFLLTKKNIDIPILQMPFLIGVVMIKHKNINV